MKIFVAGGTGFVGSYLVPYLLGQGHSVKLLVRPEVERSYPIAEGVEVIEGNPVSEGPWWEQLAECDTAINLVGTPILGRWSQTQKILIRESRLATLRNLVNAIPQTRPFTLVSTSAVGFYGDAGDRELDESAPGGDDFLGHVAQDWEAAATKARSKNARVLITRFGLVLGAGGGALAEMVKTMRRYMGGILGPGTQWVSWIHQEDLARVIALLVERPELAGVFNCSSPNPVRQAELARTLAQLLNRPVGIPTPAFPVRLALGGFADAVLFSQRMVPKALLDAGFQFRYPALEEALREILQRHRG